MRLFTSSFSHTFTVVPAASAESRSVSVVRYREWIVFTVTCLVLLCLSLEVMTRVGFGRISRVESRIASQYQAASHLQRTPGKQTILFLGNSLPLEGINVPQLQAALGQGTICVPFFIEQTQYLDWYFGMRRLFQEGSRPDIVVLSMNISHLMSPDIRGDYSAFYLFRTADIPEIGRETHLSMTGTSELLLSRFSLFYAGRTPLRNFLLNKVDRPYGDFLHDLSTRPGTPIVGSMVDEILSMRLEKIRALAESYGIRVVFLLPPGFGPNEAALVASGARAKVPVLVPVHLNAFDRSKFRDGFHLNAGGSVIFTRELAEQLREYLGQKAAR